MRSTLTDPDFDDDCEIEGSLRYCYNGDESVLRLSDDIHYGSDFRRIIEIISDLNELDIESITPHSLPLDDGKSWNEYPFAGRSEFDGITVCHAMHMLACHLGFSLPDIIRLNDFWAEVRVTFQSITEQDGTRFYSSSS